MPDQHLWLGEEWELFCLDLLRTRYEDHELQVVPARDRGDLGIEAFTHDGCLFQCYAAEEPLSVDDLFVKQRDKLTRDLNKLQLHANQLEMLLGNTVVDRYVFMVPRHDSRRLIAHAQTKAAEVVGLGLSFISPSFRIIIETADSYPRERALLAAIPMADLSPDPAWIPSADHLGLLVDARAKLHSAGLDGAGLKAVLDALESQYVLGENVLQTLRSKYPEHWKAVVAARGRNESRLALQYPPGGGTPSDLMRLIASDMVSEILAVAEPVGRSYAQDIAWATVADWLMRCPLRLDPV